MPTEASLRALEEMRARTTRRRPVAGVIDLGLLGRGR